MRPTILSSERIGKIGMVEDVEELGPELRADTLSEFPVLR